MERARDDVRVEPTRCPYCHEGIPKGEAPAVCAACHALHHAPCVEEHGRCAACGADEAFPPAPRPVEAPAPEVDPRVLHLRPWMVVAPLLGAVIGVCVVLPALRDATSAALATFIATLVLGVAGSAFDRWRRDLRRRRG